MKQVTALLLLIPMNMPALADEDVVEERAVAQHSFRLGAAAAFSEMVSFGNKKLALRSAVSSEDMAELRPGYGRGWRSSTTVPMSTGFSRLRGRCGPEE